MTSAEYRLRLNSVFPLWLRLAIGTVLAWLLTAGQAAAKESDWSDPETSGAVAEAQAAGWTAGPFLVRPGFSLTGIYDNNIFATRLDEKSDYLLLFSPSLEARTAWSRHRLRFDAAGDIGRYEDYPSENYEDLLLQASGQYDLTESGNLFGGLGYHREHEERSSPDDQNGAEPTVLQVRTAHLGVATRLGPAGLRLGGTYERLDYDDVSAVGGSVINNDDRDREQLGVGARLSLKIGPALQPFVQLVLDDRAYRAARDDAGFTRDSRGWRAAAGLKGTWHENLDAEVYAGYLRQDYDDDRFATLDATDFGAELKWRTGRATLVRLEIERSLEETTVTGASGYLQTTGRIYLDHRLTPTWSWQGYGGVSRDSFQEISRRDDYFFAGTGLSHDLTDHLYVAADYRFMSRDSSLSLPDAPEFADFDRHKLLLSLGARLHPARPDPLAAFTGILSPPTAVAAPSGFYLGAQAGHGTLVTKTREDRGHGGNSSASFGARGFDGGFFAGYGWARGRWGAGLELEGALGEADWEHGKDKPGSRSFAAQVDGFYGAGLRLGSALADGSFLYLRGGAVRTRIDIDYTLNDAAGPASLPVTFHTGYRLGMGLETPLTPRLFLRGEGSYTDYESFRVAGEGFAESFEPLESRFSLGLGWRWQPLALPPPVVSGEDLSGFYAGVLVGCGALHSRAEGVHNDGGAQAGGPFAYQADFAALGVVPGVFAGYGRVLGRLYLGAELQVEVGSAEWNRERESSGSGRTFSVERQESYGANARIGYVLPAGTLAYLQAGILESRFTTRYAKGANRSNDIDRDDDRRGYRFGYGIEVPVTAATFVRLDYLYTAYADYGFTTAHQNSDSMNFDNDENLVRLGLGFRL